MKLLKDAGIEFIVDAADLDEDDLVAGIDDPARQAAVLARAKALHVAARHPGAFVLGGDQVGVGDDDGEQWLLAKPRDSDHHVAMLLRMSGCRHTFHPAVTVTFRAFDEATARAYVSSGEGVGSCGGYESEHRGAQLIAHVDGSLQAVLGFPLLLVLPLLRAHCAVEAGLLGA